MIRRSLSSKKEKTPFAIYKQSRKLHAYSKRRAFEMPSDNSLFPPKSCSRGACISSGKKRRSIVWMPQHSFLLLSGILLSDSAQLSETIPLFLSQQSDYRFPEYQFRVCSSSIPPIRLRGWHLSRFLSPSCLIAACAALHPVLVPFYVLNGIHRGVTFPEDRPQMLLHSSQIPPSVMSSLFNKKFNRSGPSAMDSCFPHSRISPPFICLF